jgi:hypothetical protein
MLIEITEGDTEPFGWIIRDGLGNPVDLTDTQVTLRVRQGTAPALTLQLDVVPPATDGRVRHTPDGQLTPGPWIAQVPMVRSGIRATAPTSGTAPVQVNAQI